MRLPVADVHSSIGVSTPGAIQRCSPDLLPTLVAASSPCTVRAVAATSAVAAAGSADGCSGRPLWRPCLNIARVASLIGASPASSASSPFAPCGTPCSILKLRCRYMLCSAPEVNFFALDVQTVILRPSASISIWSSMFTSLFRRFAGRLDIRRVTFWRTDA